jgi:cytochrome c556
MRRLMFAFAALAGLGAAFAVAQAPTPADQVKARQENFKALGAAFKGVMDQAKTPAPDFAQMKAGSAKLKTLAGNLPTWFPPGSGQEAGVKTAAKPEIWSDSAGFAAAAKGLQDAVAKLDAAGDVNGAKAALMDVGKACGACHAKYRVKSTG